MQVEPVFTDEIEFTHDEIFRFSQYNWVSWISSSDFLSWKPESKVSIFDWYYLTAYRQQKLFHNLTPSQRAHDPVFLKSWAAGITRVYVVPPKRFRTYFTCTGSTYTLTCVPCLGVLRWLASIASTSPNSVKSIWGTQFKTVCKFNPYGLSLFAIGHDAAYPYKIGNKKQENSKLERVPTPSENEVYSNDDIATEDLPSATDSELDLSDPDVDYGY
jgi:hypothetical protein